MVSSKIRVADIAPSGEETEDSAAGKLPVNRHRNNAPMKATLMEQIDKAMKRMEEARAEAVKQPEIVKGTSAIVGHHQLRRIIKEVEPKIAGDRLSSSSQDNGDLRGPKDTKPAQ